MLDPRLVGEREGLQQVAVAHAHGWCDVAPEAAVVDGEEQAPAAVAVLTPSDRYPAGERVVGDIQRAQRPHRVAGKVDTHPAADGRAPLHDSAAQPVTGQDPCDGAPGDAAPDHENRAGHPTVGLSTPPDVDRSREHRDAVSAGAFANERVEPVANPHLVALGHVVEDHLDDRVPAMIQSQASRPEASSTLS